MARPIRLTSFRLWAPLLHLAAFAAIWTGVLWQALVLGGVLYLVRMFAITAGYHRYFSHRAYKTSRPVQFLLGFVGTMALQRGPLWWASTHRHHHRHSDTPSDPHSPIQKGFWWAHMGWLASEEHDDTDMKMIRDLAKYPELRWLEKYHWVAPLLMAVGAFLIAGWSGLVVGGVWSTLALWHGTFAINSLAHVFGRRRYDTPDDSRNSHLLALITLGEGYHNNHHHDMSSARQGFFWWEFDITYLVLKALSKIGVVWDLRAPRPDKLEATSSAKPARLTRPCKAQDSRAPARVKKRPSLGPLEISTSSTGS